MATEIKGGGEVVKEISKRETLNRSSGGKQSTSKAVKGIDNRKTLNRSSGDKQSASKAVKGISKRETLNRLPASAARLSELQRRILMAAADGLRRAGENAEVASSEETQIVFRCRAFYGDELANALTKFRQIMAAPFANKTVNLPIELVALHESELDAVENIFATCAEQTIQAVVQEFRAVLGDIECDSGAYANGNPPFIKVAATVTRKDPVGQVEEIRRRIESVIEDYTNNRDYTLTHTQDSLVQRRIPHLLIRDAVLLAGGGERTAAAEASTSRAVSRLEHRGLVSLGNAIEFDIWSPRALWLTQPGLDIANVLSGQPVESHAKDSTAA